MSNLKELTARQHKRAEGTEFIQRLLKKNMTPHEYYVYMYNQLMMYYSLETFASSAGVFDGIKEIKRSIFISRDLADLESTYGFTMPLPLKSTNKYVEYMNTIAGKSDRLLAHVYVRHMGDLSGGQIIKRFVPGSGKFYEFEGDINTLKEKFRAKLHDGLADEAKVCFDMVTEFMIELESSFGTVGKTD